MVKVRIRVMCRFRVGYIWYVPCDRGGTPILDLTGMIVVTFRG